MKKIIVPLLVLSLSASLTGCFWSDKDEQHQVGLLATELFEGEIETLPAKIDGLDVTHVFITNDKERVYLKSIMFDLDQYLGQAVRVSGNVFQDEVAGKPVNVLTVETIDLLSGYITKSTEDWTTFSSTELGVSVEYDKNLYSVETTNTRMIFTSKEYSGTVSLKLFKESSELDYDLFVDSNYKNVGLLPFNGNGVTGEMSENPAVYLFKRGEYFYELTTLGFDSSAETSSALLKKIVDRLQFIDLRNSSLNKELDADGVEVEMDASGTETEGVLDENLPVDKKEEIVSRYSPVITMFDKQVKNLLPKFNLVVSYAFTDNEHFYLVYLDKNSTSHRALFRYDNNFEFFKVGEFERGGTFDWELIEGENTVYDRPQTVIIMTEEGEQREIEVHKGYRYFESLPLGFGMQYPQNWYYSRENDSYVFADKPLSETDIIIRAELKKESFESIGMNSIEAGIKMKTEGDNIVYVVKAEDHVIQLQGDKKYTEQLGVMARSVRYIDK